MTIPRFHLPCVRPGSTDLPETALIHATRVLRLQEGDALRVFDAGLEFGATIVAIAKHRVRIEVGEEVASLPERTIPLHLIMSPLKGDLTELVIQKATELGVSRISPVAFERTDTVARRDPGEVRKGRWHRVATSAAEQSGRTVVPAIDSPTTLRQAVDALGAPRDHEARIVAAEPSLDQDNRRAPGDSRTVRSLVVAVGPAGGLTESDLTVLRSAAFTPQRLAVHTLRSETACIAAVAILGDRFR
ncbi:MAG: 16S rRNA (uracil(1498)-N(3))-methyltransferase [Vicinamibacteria bacterium]|nr:16S rRNA (uracil(1498)-N(3))-methyltransferase [Vicinamibacteria bacterium]